MPSDSMEAVLREKYVALKPALNERTRRLWAAAEAQVLGRGGQSLVARVTGLARSTIYLGLRELRALETASPTAESLPPERVRRSGGGRKSLLYHQPTLLGALEAL